MNSAPSAPASRAPTALDLDGAGTTSAPREDPAAQHQDSTTAGSSAAREGQPEAALSRDSSGGELAEAVLRSRLARQQRLALGRDSSDDLLTLQRNSSSAELLAHDTSSSSADDDLLNSSADDLLDGPETPARVDVSDRPQWGRLIPLYFLQFCESWNSDSLFSYVAFLVMDFSPGLTQDEVGKWAGFIASMYFFGQFFSSYFWGWMSDRFGRKNLLVVGAIGTLISILSFGFSQSLWWAVGARCLCGVLNGNIGIVKSFVGEISTSKTQAVSFGYLAIGWSSGSICGSLLGGLLARPAKKWPLFVGTVFDSFPYLLTSLMNALVMALGVVVTAWLLRDPERRVRPALAGADADEQQASSENAGVRLRRKLGRVLRQLLWVFGQLHIMLPVLMYVVAGSTDIFVKETLPLFFVASPAAGGLNFTTTQTGAINSVPGVSAMLFQLFLYKRVATHFGPRRTFRIGIVSASLINCLFPFCNFFYRADDPNILMWAFLICIFLMQPAAMQCIYASVFAMISNSCETERMGQVHGVSQSLVALLRAIAPIVAGRLFAWSVEEPPHPFPINVWFNFLLQLVVFAVILLGSCLISPSVEKPKAEQIELESLPKHEQSIDQEE